MFGKFYDVVEGTAEVTKVYQFPIKGLMVFCDSGGFTLTVGGKTLTFKEGDERVPIPLPTGVKDFSVGVPSAAAFRIHVYS